jgi:hypothetical protein
VHTKAELIEISAVAVPSNRDALVQASAKGLQIAEQLKQQLDQTRIATAGDLIEMREDLLTQFARAIGDLKDTVTTAMAVKIEATQDVVPVETATESGESDSDEQAQALRRAVGYLDQYLEL